MKKNNCLSQTDLAWKNRKFLLERFFRYRRLFACLIVIAAFSGKYAYPNEPVTPDAAAEVLTIPTLADNEIVLLQIRLSGTVTDQQNNPLPGTTITVEGTSTGTVADIDGKYLLENVESDAILSVSFVGYITRRIPVDGRTTIDIVLDETLEALDEVIVVGYGVQRRTTMTGSVSVAAGEELARAPVSNVSSALAGRLSGVIMRSAGGKPGNDNPEIYVRGIATTGGNAPLIVIDGIIRDNITQIDPQTIESVTILKDASAVAPYGLGGANGVILITTKKGQIGRPTLSFNSYYGTQTPTEYPDLLDAKDYMRLRNEAYRNENPGLTTIPFAEDLIADYDALNAQDPDRYPNSNTRSLMNMTHPIQQHNLQLSGGTEDLVYFGSLGFMKQDGLFDQVDYNRINYTLNTESQVTNTTRVTFNLLGSVERRNDLDVASSAAQMFRNGYKFIPTEALEYSNGLWGQFAGNTALGVLNAGYAKDDQNTLLGTIAIEQQMPFFEGLSAKATFSYDTRNNDFKGWHTPFYFWTQDLNTTPYTYERQISTQEGSVPTYTYLSQTRQRRTFFSYQGFLNYSRSFGLHDITGLFVAEARENRWDELFARRNNFAIGIDELNMGSSNRNDFDNGGSSSVGTQIGYVYRFGYVYNHKYMFEASGRYDGHYYFAPDERWGFFPAFALGWRVSEENFMEPLEYVNNLKLRASWGKSGNLAGSAYQYLSGYTLGGNRYGWGTGTMVQGAYQTRESNPLITWEVSTKSNIGVEAILWNSLLIFEFDYFTERRTGMLLPPDVTVPFEYGISLADENAGIMENSGIELILGTRHQFANGLRIGFDGSMSYATNKMIEVFETSATFDNPNRRRTGRPFNTRFGYQSDGLFSTGDDSNGNGVIDSEDGYNITQFGILHPGDVRYVDINGDGVINSDDEMEIGYPEFPLMNFGFNMTADWKGFDLGMFFQGSAMSSVFINNFMTVPFLNNNSNADYEYFNDRWTPDNQGATYPRATSSPYTNNVQTSDFWLRNSSYLRLKTASLGYTIPGSILQNIRLQNIRVHVTAQNLITFSSIKFMDPELRGDTAYPNVKTVTFGANVTF
ncbi:MAG: SusC/RagA family TonB-linked outer membrane protein [Bacteroidales bacterium]